MTVLFIDFKVYSAFGLNFLFWYIAIAVVMPFIYLVYTTIMAKEKEDYTFMSRVTKFLMLAGVLSMTFIFLKF